MSRARPLPADLTVTEKIRRRRVLRTRWPGIYEVIGSDGRTRYRILAREGLCRCKGGSKPFRCWHARAVRQRHQEEMLTTEPTAEPTPAEADGQKPKRRRRTKAEIEAAAAETLANLPADLPPFHASIVSGHVTATAERKVNVGQYESFTARIHMDFERDPRFGVQDCAGMLADAARAEVDRVCDAVQSQMRVEK